MNAKKCDVCKGLYTSGETLGGSLASHIIGESLAYYPNPRLYDFCTNCAKVFESYLRDALHQLRRELGGGAGEKAE